MFPDYREIILHRSRSGLGYNFVKNIQLKRRWRRKTGLVEFEECNRKACTAYIPFLHKMK